MENKISSNSKPVFIISPDENFIVKCKGYLSSGKFEYPIDIKVYEHADKCVPDLTSEHTNIIIIDYQEREVNHLKDLLNEPKFTIYDNRILILKHPTHDYSKVGSNETILIKTDQNEFPQITQVVGDLLRFRKSKNKFLTSNYIFAGILFFVVLVLLLYVLFGG